MERLTNEEMRDLKRRANAGDTDARETLILRNQPLVHELVRPYTRAGIPYRDLLSWGMCGLVKGVDEWDPDHPSGAQLCTVVNLWVRKYMDNIAIPAHSSYFHVSADARQLCSKVLRNRKRGLPDPPMTPHVAERVNAAMAARGMRRHILGEPDSRRAVRPVWGWRKLPPPGADRTHGDDVEVVELLMRLLTPREAKVVRMYFGLAPATEPMDNRAIGRVLGVSGEAIRQVKKRAMDKLQAAAASQYADSA